jgi:hypothetical protein
MSRRLLVSAEELEANVRSTVRAALFFATFYSVYVLMVALLRRSFTFPQYHTSAAVIIAGYYVAALVTGTIVGVLWPLTRTAWGSFLVGSIGGTMTYGSIALIVVREGPLWLMLIPGVIVGGGIALVWHSKEHPDPRGHRQGRTILLILGVGLVLILLAVTYAAASP